MEGGCAHATTHAPPKSAYSMTAKGEKTWQLLPYVDNEKLPYLGKNHVQQFSSVHQTLYSGNNYKITGCPSNKSGRLKHYHLRPGPVAILVKYWAVTWPGRGLMNTYDYIISLVMIKSR